MRLFDCVLMFGGVGVTEPKIVFFIYKRVFCRTLPRCKSRTLCFYPAATFSRGPADSPTSFWHRTLRTLWTYLVKQELTRLAPPELSRTYSTLYSLARSDTHLFYCSKVRLYGRSSVLMFDCSLTTRFVKASLNIDIRWYLCYNVVCMVNVRLFDSSSVLLF